VEWSPDAPVEFRGAEKVPPWRQVPALKDLEPFGLNKE